MSGVSSATRRNASSPSGARICPRLRREASSASEVRIRPRYSLMATPPASSSARSWNLQRNSERCALSGLGLEREAPAVRFDDAARDRQPEAGSPPLRGHEEIEDVEPGLDARPRVGDAEHGGAILDVARQLQSAPTLHRLHSVADEVDQHLLDLLAVEAQTRHRGSEMIVKCDALLARRRSHQGEHLADELVQVRLGEREPVDRGEREELLDETIESRDLPSRRFDERRQLGALRLAEPPDAPREENELEVDRVERVADFVGETRRQGARRRKTL